MITCAETSQLDFLSILDLFGVAVSPFHWHVGIRICVHENVECTISVEDWEEGDRGSDLAEDSLDLLLDLVFGLLRLSGGRCRITRSMSVQL